MARVWWRVLAIVEAAFTWALTPDGYACIRGAYPLNFFLQTHSLVFFRSH